MLDKQKANKYLRRVVYRYIIKFPILVFIVLFLGFAGLYMLISTTSTDVFKAFQGSIEMRPGDNAPVIRIVPDSDLASKITADSRAFWYLSKQDKIYSVAGIEVTQDDGETFIELISAPDGEPALEASVGVSVSVDIAVGKQSLLDRILNKGAKTNGGTR